MPRGQSCSQTCSIDASVDTHKVDGIRDAILLLDVSDHLARDAAIVSVGEALISLNLDQSSQTHFTLLDLGTLAWLCAFASSSVVGRVLDSIRHVDWLQSRERLQLQARQVERVEVVRNPKSTRVRDAKRKSRMRMLQQRRQQWWT